MKSHFPPLLTLVLGKKLNTCLELFCFKYFLNLGNLNCLQIKTILIKYSLQLVTITKSKIVFLKSFFFHLNLPNIFVEMSYVIYNLIRLSIRLSE